MSTPQPPAPHHAWDDYMAEQDRFDGAVVDAVARALDNGAKELLAVRAIARHLFTVAEFDQFDDIFNDLISEYAASAAREAAPDGEEPIDTTEVIKQLESWFDFHDAVRLLNKKAAL